MVTADPWPFEDREEPDRTDPLDGVVTTAQVGTEGTALSCESLRHVLALMRIPPPITSSLLMSAETLRLLQGAAPSVGSPPELFGPPVLTLGGFDVKESPLLPLGTIVGMGGNPPGILWIMQPESPKAPLTRAERLASHRCRQHDRRAMAKAGRRERTGRAGSGVSSGL